MKKMSVKPLKEDLLIIGNGMATDRLLECLSGKPHQFRIRVIGDEACHAYNRVQLSSVLAAERSSKDLQLKQSGWYQEHKIEVTCGDAVEKIDIRLQTVTTASGAEHRYDKLVLATGSRAAIPNISGSKNAAVRCFRNLNDVDFLIAQSKSIRSVAIVGGGLLGLEAAHGMNLAGVSVHLVHRREHLMNRQLNRRAGEILQSQLEQRGIRFHMGTNPIAVQSSLRSMGNSAINPNTELVLENGERIQTDLVIFAAGIEYNKELAEQAGLDCNKAIKVDSSMQTSDSNIYAIGECAEHKGRTIGLVAPAKIQAEVLADNLLGKDSHYSYSETGTRLKVSGIELFSSGEIENLAENNNDLIIEDAKFGIYRHLSIQDNQVTAAVLLGDSSSGNWYEELIKDKSDLGGLIPKLIFGRDYCSKPSVTCSEPSATEKVPQIVGDQTNQVIEVMQ